MKPRRFTSQQDLAKVVDNNTFPDMCSTDRLILQKMVIDCTYHTASHAHPGIKKLRRVVGGAGGKDGMGVAKSTIQRAFDRLEFKHGAIECTGNRKGGRGLAAEYRFCIENEHYVDHKPACRIDDLEKDSAAAPVGAVKGSARLPKGSAQIENGSVYEPEYPLKGSVQALPHPILHPNPIQPPSNSKDFCVKPGEAEAFILKRSAIFGTASDSIVNRIEAMIKRQGRDMAEKLATRFENRVEGFGGLKTAWGLFLSQERMLVLEVKKAVDDAKVSAERLRLTEERIIREVALEDARKTAEPPEEDAAELMKLFLSKDPNSGVLE